MPTIPDDRSTGAARAADPEELLAAAEDAHLAARRAPAQRPGTQPPPVRRSGGTRRRAGESPGGTRRRAGELTSPHRPAGPYRSVQLVLAAIVAAGWAAIQGFLLVLLVMALVQLAEGHAGSLGGLATLSLAGWLLGHGVPLETGAGPLGLAPLVLTGFAAWRVANAGTQVTRAIRVRGTGSARGAAIVAVAVGCAYGLMGLLAAVALDSPGIGVSVGRAALNLAVFGVVASGVGALGTTGAFNSVVAGTPTAIRDGVRSGVVAALIVIGAGAGLAGLALAFAGGEAADTIAAYRTGVAGQAGITLLCLAYAPNAATWAAAYLVGPGFVVGQQTVVRVTEVSVNALPALPLFAGLPGGELGGAGLALLAVPAAAGMAAGVMMVRQKLREGERPDGGGWSGLIAAAVLAGPVAGLVLGLACVVSSGPLGGGRLSQVGPVAWQVGLVAAGVVAGGALLGTATTRLAVRR